MVFDIGVCSNPIDDSNVIVEDGSDDRNHIRLHNPCPHSLRATDTDIHNALEGKAPFPHLHHIFAPAFLQYAYQAFHPAIDGQYISDSSR